MQASLIAQAAGWGLLSASGLLLGAAIGYWIKLPKVVIASLMAYGSGVLIAALCFSQIPEAHHLGGSWITLGGLFAGGGIFLLASKAVERLEKRHRAAGIAAGSTVALLIALGAVLDGVPESLSLGLGLLDGSGISVALFVAIFLSNLPEGLASAVDMREEGRSARYVFALWGGIVVFCMLSAMAGPALFADVSAPTLAFLLAFSAGAVMCMLVDTMIPDAFATTHAWTGMITLLGFMTAFALHHGF